MIDLDLSACKMLTGKCTLQLHTGIERLNLGNCAGIEGEFTAEFFLRVILDLIRFHLVILLECGFMFSPSIVQVVLLGIAGSSQQTDTGLTD
jgi:hypothetical protein